MWAEGITESSVLLFRQNSALKFLLNDFKNTALATVCDQLKTKSEEIWD